MLEMKIFHKHADCSVDQLSEPENTTLTLVTVTALEQQS